jgi:hypothetical protein
MLDGGVSCEVASIVLATIVRTKAHTLIAAGVGSAGRRSPKASIPPAIGTRLESAEESGIVIMPRA